ncbi:hypothetical protein PVL29_005293 [Vitis rotundifolia]|uniref:Uncharacterized protein n=1 Tax=Vitis rotundifolia TaxID=103349 RepID=A0AA39AAL8_VITRO|nr:hypothetical protein PVL29_005293 [Vitis rotundifolia]
MLNIIIANGLEGHIDGSLPSSIPGFRAPISESRVHTVETPQSASFELDLLVSHRKHDGSLYMLEFGTGDLGFSELGDRLKTIFDKFDAIGEPLSYRDKIIHTFRGLGPEYNAMVSTISARPDRPSIEEIHNLLINHDYRLEEQQTSDHLNLNPTHAQLAQLNLSQF